GRRRPRPEGGASAAGSALALEGRGLRSPSPPTRAAPARGVYPSRPSSARNPPAYGASGPPTRAHDGLVNAVMIFSSPVGIGENTPDGAQDYAECRQPGTLTTASYRRPVGITTRSA